MTGGELPSGPGLVADRINGDVEVSQQQTLLCREGGGSRCNFGNLILVPLGDSLLYVQPLYVRSERENAPALLQRVIVEFNGSVAIADNLIDALAALDTFAAIQEGPDGEPVEPEEPTEPTEPTEPGDPSTIAQLLAEADDLFAQADAALAQSPPDFAAFGDLYAQAQAKIDEVQAILNATTAPPADGPPRPCPPTARPRRRPPPNQPECAVEVGARAPEVTPGSDARGLRLSGRRLPGSSRARGAARG